jgi:hypothetical protein
VKVDEKAVYSSEHIICQTTLRKFPEDTFSYSNITPHYLSSLSNMYNIYQMRLCSNKFTTMSCRAVAVYFVLLLPAFCNFLKLNKYMTI